MKYFLLFFTCRLNFVFYPNSTYKLNFMLTNLVGSSMFWEFVVNLYFKVISELGSILTMPFVMYTLIEEEFEFISKIEIRI